MDQLLDGQNQPPGAADNLTAMSGEVSAVIRHALTLSRDCHPTDASEISLSKFFFYDLVLQI